MLFRLIRHTQHDCGMFLSGFWSRIVVLRAPDIWVIAARTWSRLRGQRLRPCLHPRQHLRVDIADVYVVPQGGCHVVMHGRLGAQA